MQLLKGKAREILDYWNVDSRYTIFFIFSELGTIFI